MRIFYAYCDSCGWSSDQPLTEAQAEELVKHRCRACLKADPASQVRFKVRDIISNIPKGG